MRTLNDYFKCFSPSLTSRGQNNSKLEVTLHGDRTGVSVTMVDKQRLLLLMTAGFRLDLVSIIGFVVGDSGKPGDFPG